MSGRRYSTTELFKIWHRQLEEKAALEFVRNEDLTNRNCLKWILYPAVLYEDGVPLSSIDPGIFECTFGYSITPEDEAKMADAVTEMIKRGYEQ